MVFFTQKNLGLLIPYSTVVLEKLAVSQLVKKFPLILWKPEAHYRLYKCSPPVLVLIHINTVHAPHTTS